MAAMIPDPEREERRLLLQAAANGNVAAQVKLEAEYHVRVHSAAECEQYAATRRSDSKLAPARRVARGNTGRKG